VAGRSRHALALTTAPIARPACSSQCSTQRRHRHHYQEANVKSTARLARTLLPIMSLLASSACTLDPEPVPLTGMGTRGLIGLPNEHAGSTRAYLASLNFAGLAKRSRINCHGGGRPVEIDIDPEQRSHYVDPLAASERGRIVARIRNVDTINCADLHLAPGDTAYWWMGSSRGHAVTIDFWSIPSSGPIRHLAETGPVIWHRDGQRTAPDAKLSNVIVHPAHSDGDDNGDVEPLRFGHNSTWIACLSGCCESTSMIDNYY
jgi:hypothetical protein